VRWARPCKQGLPLDGLRVKTSLSPQSCGTPIIGRSASNQLLRRSLNRLGLNYLDLYLIHAPFAFQPGDEQDPRLLAWAVQRGTALLTTPRTAARAQENFNVSALPAEALDEINRIQTRQRFNEVVKTGSPGFIPQGR
jgi:diketogulonate reductase-like aldo/keto reductase